MARPVTLLLILGVFLALLAIAYIVGGVIDHERGRPCPRCGLPVQRGEMDCGHCGFDFRTIGEQENAAAQ